MVKLVFSFQGLNILWKSVAGLSAMPIMRGHMMLPTKRVLVVDDTPKLSLAQVRLLEKVDHRVISAATREDAFPLIKAKNQAWHCWGFQNQGWGSFLTRD